MCETKNNVWKKYELSIQNSIDNCTEIIKIEPDSASLNKRTHVRIPYKQRESAEYKSLMRTF